MFRLGSVFTILCLVIVGIYFVFNGDIELNEYPFQEQWRLKLDGEVRTLSNNGDRIIFVRISNQLYALEKETGNILWQHHLAWQGIPKPPIASNGIVFLADGKAILALDQENGNVKWTREVPLSSASVELITENVTVVKMSSYVYVLNAMDGTVLWSKPECRYGDFPVYSENSYLYSPCVNNITTMNIKDGKVAWDAQEPIVNAKVAYQDTTMYYSLDRESISALDLRTRTILWESSFTGAGYREFHVTGNILVVTGSDILCVFERETGDQKWCSGFNNPQNPAIIDLKLFVFDGFQNNIAAFDMVTGSKLGELTFKRIRPFSVDSALLTTIDGLLVFGNGSSIFAFGK